VVALLEASKGLWLQQHGVLVSVDGSRGGKQMFVLGQECEDAVAQAVVLEAGVVEKVVALLERSKGLRQ
jgi:hypothetical protein